MSMIMIQKNKTFKNYISHLIIMTWTDDNDKEVQECLDRVLAEQKKLESKLRPIEIIINNTRRIQSKESTSYNKKRERIITKIPPKDKWGEIMADEIRLEIKNQCIAKTNELLGEIPTDN